MNGRFQREIAIDQRVEEKLNEMPTYVRDWYFNMKASRMTAETRRDYVKKIEHLLTSINPDLKKITPADINIKNVTDFYLSIQTKVNNGVSTYTSDSYQISMWYCLNNFFKYLVKSNVIDQNYIELISKPKNHDLERINEHRVLMTEKDFINILNAVSHESNLFIKTRDLAIITLFMNTGMRKTAMSNILIEDVNFEERKLTVIDKGNKRHEYVLAEGVLNAIKDWMEYRGESVDNHLFLSNRRVGIASDSIDHIIKKYTTNALGKPLSPHKLRAGYCSILYNKTGDIEFVRRCVGHSNVNTTQRYIVTKGSEKQKAADIMNSVLTSEQ